MMNTKRNYTVVESISNATILRVSDKDGNQLIADGTLYLGTLTSIGEVTFDGRDGKKVTQPSPHFQLLEPCEYEGTLLSEGTTVCVCGYAFTKAVTENRMAIGSQHAFQFRGIKKIKGGGNFNDWSINRIEYKEAAQKPEAVPLDDEEFGDFTGV